jgi:hypothetical protein
MQSVPVDDGDINALECTWGRPWLPLNDPTQFDKLTELMDAQFRYYAGGTHRFWGSYGDTCEAFLSAGMPNLRLSAAVPMPIFCISLIRWCGSWLLNAVTGCEGEGGDRRVYWPARECQAEAR